MWVPDQFYTELMAAFESRRRALGLTMAQLDNLSGNADGLYAKLLHADKPSGQRASILHLSFYACVLWPSGHRIAILPPASITKNKNMRAVPEQLLFDFDVFGQHQTLTRWQTRRRQPRAGNYRRGKIAA